MDAQDRMKDDDTLYEYKLINDPNKKTIDLNRCRRMKLSEEFREDFELYNATDENVKYWINRLDELEAQIKKNENVWQLQALHLEYFGCSR